MNAEFDLGDGLHLSLHVPRAARDVAPIDVDLAALPGASLTLARAWQLDSGGRLDVACASASARLWIEGLEGPVLSGASALARKHLKLPALMVGEIARDGDVFVQRFSGDGAVGTVGRHVLAFARGASHAHVCTVVCRDAACAVDFGQTTIAGALAPTPSDGPASWLMSALLTHPRASGVVATSLLLLGVIWLLVRRPRPRPLSAGMRRRC